jgi:hypothetical protein
MLFVYYGDDVTKVRIEALKKASSLLTEGGEVTFIASENASIEILKDIPRATSLFRSHEVYMLDTLSDDEVLFEMLVELLPALQDSGNQFVVIEQTLSPKMQKLFAEHAHTAEQFLGKARKPFNIFALSDALCARDKKTLWILLQEALREGKTSEELIGTIFWQLKMLRLGEVTKSALEAGQKPFVYDKAKRALSKYKHGELTELSHELLVLYHKGHMGLCTLSYALEAWVLKL